MQVSATLIAAQQAAREARTRLQIPQQGVAQVHKPEFAAALEKMQAATGNFEALPLRQVAPATPAPTTAASQPGSPPARMGQLVNILV